MDFSGKKAHCKQMTKHISPPNARSHTMRTYKNHVFFPVIMGLALTMTFMPLHTAHAGFFSWLDEATTFNEEQKRPLKPDVLPKGPPAPLLYDGQKADEWNKYYTREDLEPTRYMEGSATMAMRPKSVIEAQEKGLVLDANGRALVGPDGNPITEQELIQRRAALNKAKEAARKRKENRRRLYIGEPERMPGENGRMPQQRREANLGLKTNIGQPGRNDGDLGVKTQIRPPVQDWRERSRNMHTNPQPGDYDYRGGQGGRARFDDLQTYTTPPSQQRRALNEQGGRRERGRRSQPQGQQSRGQGGQFDPQFDQNFPDNYTVRKGDTLSGISDKDRIYGDWQMWPLIHDANRSQISHPDRIYPEQRFDIPRDYTVDDVEGARNRAAPPYDWVK